MPFIIRTLRAWASVISHRAAYMFYHIVDQSTMRDYGLIAVKGNRAWNHYLVDRDDSRDPRPEDRSHFFNFGGLFFPNEAGRNCLPAVSWTAHKNQLVRIKQKY